ncbi:hypothetical protein Tco_0647840 [Tanacetum coccineum]
MLIKGVPLVDMLGSCLPPAYVDSESITQADGAQSSRVLVPLSDDPYVAIGQARLVDTESEPEEEPSEVEELQSLGSIVPLIARVTEAMALSNLAFRKRYRSSYESPSSSLSPDLPEYESLDADERGRESEEEAAPVGSAAPEGQQQAVLVVDTAMSKPLGLGYRAARRRALDSI